MSKPADKRDEVERPVARILPSRWYYYDAEYPDEGSVGPFHSRQEAEKSARDAGYVIESRRTAPAPGKGSAETWEQYFTMRDAPAPGSREWPNTK